MTAAMAKLSDVLRLEVDAVPVDPSEIYRFAGVYSFGRGLFARGELSGQKTSYKVFHRLHVGDFVISEPKAWEGAIARIPESYDGWFLSPVFPTFRIHSDAMVDRYLELYLKQPRVWRRLRTGAKGLGARRETVSTAQFLDLDIPLPSRAEQERVVSLLRDVETAIQLNREAGEELDALFRSASAAAFDGKL